MVRYTPEHKERTRKRIVDAASEVFRAAGAQKARVEDIMGAAGLTAGGFYRHYESKDDLLCDALTRALDDSRRMIALAGATTNGQEEFLRNAAAHYLSSAHKDNVAQGCAIPALTADVSRSGESVRAHFQDELQATVDEIKRHLEGTDEERERKAWQLTAINLGGILLARAVKDDTVAERILEDCRAVYESAESNQV